MQFLFETFFHISYSFYIVFDDIHIERKKLIFFPLSPNKYIILQICKKAHKKYVFYFELLCNIFNYQLSKSSEYCTCIIFLVIFLDLSCNDAKEKNKHCTIVWKFENSHIFIFCDSLLESIHTWTVSFKKT